MRFPRDDDLQWLIALAAAQLASGHSGLRVRNLVCLVTATSVPSVTVFGP